MALKTAGLGYVGAGGQRFQSSVLAQASMPGGYSITRPNTPAETAAFLRARGASQSAGASPNVSPEARSALQSAMERYAPGGGFGKGVEAGLERGRIQSVASGMQNLVGAGLAGTTMAAGLGKKYESEVAAPTRARLEDTRASAIASLQTMLAQMEQGGYQAGLGRQFSAEQSMLDRAHEQSTATPPSYAPAGSAAQPATSPSKSGYTPRSMPEWSDTLSSAVRAYKSANKEALPGSNKEASPGSNKEVAPGPNWATINGERWKQDEKGHWVVDHAANTANVARTLLATM